MRTLEIASNIGTSAASRNPSRNISQTPGLNNIATTGEGIRVLQKCKVKIGSKN